MTVLNETPRAFPPPKALLPELLVEILVGLCLEDVLACQLVSRAWHTAFTGSIVVTVLCRRYFPALPRPYVLADFQAECRRYLRRRRGDFTTRCHHVLTYEGGGFVPDEVFHPRGVLPPPGLCDPPMAMVGYGEGNVVWTSGPDRLCVDNLYTRKRKVLDTQGWPTFVDTTIAKVTGSVLLHEHLPKSVHIHNIATDTGVVVPLCSKPLATHARKNQALVLTQTFWLYAVDYSGIDRPVVRRFSIVDSFNDPGPRDVDLVIIPCMGAGTFVDPCDPQRYFVATLSQRRLNLGRPNCQGVSPGPYGAYLFVMEFHGSTLTATYGCEEWKLTAAGLINAFGVESGELRSHLIAQTPDLTTAPGELSLLAVEADGHGTFLMTGLDITCRNVAAAGLPGPINSWAKYRLFVTFNIITKQFGQQWYLSESRHFPLFVHPPWNRQYFLPHLEPDRVMNISVLEDIQSNNWRSTRQERRYSLPIGVDGVLGALPQTPELPADVAQSPDVDKEASSGETEISDTTSEGWETVSEDSGRVPDVVDTDVWQDSDFMVFHDSSTENYAVWDFREDSRGSVAPGEARCWA